MYCSAFDLSQPIDLGIGSKSLLMADDGASVFTTPISYHGNIPESYYFAILKLSKACLDPWSKPLQLSDLHLTLRWPEEKRRP